MSKNIFNIEESDIEERFWAKVNKTSYCWEWTGNLNSSGYGTIRVKGKTYTTHRFSFILSNGYVPSSKKDIMHICDNKQCVNPSHLKEGTRLDNILDFISKGGTYGKFGERNHLSKLTNKQYENIKNRIKNGETITNLAKEHKLTRQSLVERLRREVR